MLQKTTAVYAKYDPDYLAEAREALSTLFRQVEAVADLWTAGHLRAKIGNGLIVVLRRDSPEAAEFLARKTGQGG